MSEDREFRLIRRGVYVVLAVGLTVWMVVCVKFWFRFRKQSADIRRTIAAMTPLEKDKAALDIYAAMFNASQTNWTIIVVPRTNVIEKP